MERTHVKRPSWIVPHGAARVERAPWGGTLTEGELVGVRLRHAHVQLRAAFCDDLLNSLAFCRQLKVHELAKVCSDRLFGF